MDIPDSALRDAMRFTRAKTKRAAIVTALEDFNRRQRMAELVSFAGTCDNLMSFEELMELRERDLAIADRLHSK